MTASKTTKSEEIKPKVLKHEEKPDWEIDSWESYFLDDKLPPAFRLAVVENLLADQRDEILDLVEKEVTNDYLTLESSRFGFDFDREEFCHWITQKLSSLRLSIKKKV